MSGSAARRSGRRFRLAAIAHALVGLALAAPAAAQVSTSVTITPSRPGAPNEPDPVVTAESQFGTAAGVRVEMRSLWPRVLSKGYFPVLVELENETDEERVVVLELARSGATYVSRYVTGRTVALAPGERRQVELLSTAFEVETRSGWAGDRSYYLTATIVGDDERYRGDSALGAHGVPALPVVVTGERLPSEPELELLVDGLEANTGHQAQVAAVPTADLPARFEAYTSLALVVVDLRGGMPDEDALEPILTWARLGGAVAFVGTGAREQVGALGLVRPWVDRRFERAGAGPGVWRMGLGAIMVFESSSLGRERDATAMTRVLDDLPSSAPRSIEPRWDARVPIIPDLGELPYRGFGALMVLFALLVGPVNFILLKRLGRSALLLVTIPTLALVSSLGVLAYGTIHQGLDVKRAEHSLTLLDQRAHQASTVAVRHLFAGLATRGGLLPGPGTACFPLQHSRQRGQAREFGLAMGGAGGGVSLAGAFVPPRVPLHYVFASDRPARLRLDVARDGEAFSASNELTETVRRLALLAPDGAWHAADGACAPGQSVRLSPFDGRWAEELLRIAADRGLWPEGDEVPPGSYLAVVDEDPFVDDCGLESVSYGGWHLVVGLLGEEAWR